MGDLVLSNARLLDGRGGTLERATVRVSAGRVAERNGRGLAAGGDTTKLNELSAFRASSARRRGR